MRESWYVTLPLDFLPEKTWRTERHLLLHQIHWSTEHSANQRMVRFKSSDCWRTLSRRNPIRHDHLFISQFATKMNACCTCQPSLVLLLPLSPLDPSLQILFIYHLIGRVPHNSIFIEENKPPFPERISLTFQSPRVHMEGRMVNLRFIRLVDRFITISAIHLHFIISLFTDRHMVGNEQRRNESC